MLQPVMTFRIFAILLLLLVSVPAFAEAARLTFGVAPGTTRALDSENQARRLASDLAEALDDDVTVRLFDDQLQLGQWLNQFAMVDLGVMDAAFLASHAGEFLVLGPLDRNGQLFVVARQGATGDLPRRVVSALRRDGGMRAPTPVNPAVLAVPLPVAAAAATPPPRAMEIPVKPLILGLVTGRDGVFGSSAEAEQFAVRLGERLGIPVRPRLFDNEQALADWFLRFRMIDLAVIGESGRRDPLVGDYRPLEHLSAAKGVSRLLVARRDLPQVRLDDMLQALAARGGETKPAEATVPPTAEPPVLVAAPAPTLPNPPQLPAWPEPPAVPPTPEKPEAATPAPVLPPLPVVPPAAEPAVQPPVAIVVPAPAMPEPPEPPERSPVPSVPPEEPGLPSVAEPVESLPNESMPPQPEMTGGQLQVETAPVVEPVPEAAPAPPLLPPVEAFRMPASAGPVGTLAEPEARLSDKTVEPLAGMLPKSAAPAAVPVAPTPLAPEAVVASPLPAAVPELPFTPVLPQAVVDVPASVSGQERAAEPVATPPPVEEPVPAVTVAPMEPAAVPSEPAVAQTAPEAIPDLPFIPVPPRVIEAGSVTAAGQDTAAVTPAEEAELALAAADAVPESIAQPDLPQELRPPGVPLPRPGRAPKAEPPAEEPLLLAKLQESLGRTPKPAPLLPPPDPEPGVVYVAPFITLMVPGEVRERIFDQFIDTLNQRGTERKLKFVILKQGLDKVDRGWLGARKHALGEIYGYVEDSGCCSTDLRTRVRLTYYRANQPEPALKFEYPVRVFFDHDRSTLAVERQKLADQIAAALVDELLKALQP
ncbi:MAG: hypothetical protein FIB02_05305 [Desulfuromonas sp.]|nr:hypothetical protein [Desulfuromonas sp.]